MQFSSGPHRDRQSFTLTPKDHLNPTGLTCIFSGLWEEGGEAVENQGKYREKILTPHAEVLRQESNVQPFCSTTMLPHIFPHQVFNKLGN